MVQQTTQSKVQEKPGSLLANLPERVLLGPGPSQVDPQILQAMALPLVGHLDRAFLELMEEIQRMLRGVFETDNRLTIPISGTGSAAMEAAVANLVEPGDPVLVCIHGYFGNRLAEMARRYGGEVRTISRPWGEPISSQDISQALETGPVKAVAIVHAETSTGVLQPLDEIAALVHDSGALLIVDAVTSLGGMPVEVDRLGIDVCYSGTQKCLGCPPGLGPISFAPRAVEALARRKTPATSWYLDLSLIERYWGTERTYHHTAPISANYALYEGLRIIEAEGLQNRFARHRQNAERLWSGLEALGLELLVPAEFRLPSLTTVRVPEGLSEGEVRRKLIDQYNIEIAGGLGELSGNIWRIGLMGFSSQEVYVDLLLSALKEILSLSVK